MNKHINSSLMGILLACVVASGCGGSSDQPGDGGINTNNNNNDGPPAEWWLQYYAESYTYDATSQVLTIQSLVDTEHFPREACGWARYNEAIHVFHDDEFPGTRESSWRMLTDEEGSARIAALRSGGLQVELSDGTLVAFLDQRTLGSIAIVPPRMISIASNANTGGLYAQCGAGRFCGDFICSAEDLEDIASCSVDCGCDNGILNDGEECEVGVYGGRSCVDFGFSGGLLGCHDCVITTDDCTML